MVIDRGRIHSIIVAVPEQAAVVQTALDLVDDGVQFIELCGGFEPMWAGRVIEATRGRVPVGTVGYAGGESVRRMAAIFAPEPCGSADSDGPDSGEQAGMPRVLAGGWSAAWPAAEPGHPAASMVALENAREG
jgi:hypothetical protein